MKDSATRLIIAMFLAFMLALSLGLGWLKVSMRKHSIEHIVGHPISWWDAVWTE